jgi:hypothetical protein
MTETTDDEWVTIEIDVIGKFFNHWPRLQLLVNDQTYYDNQVLNEQTITIHCLCAKNNTLRLVHYGKQFGENGIYDSLSDGSESCEIVLRDIRFNAVSIDLMRNDLVFNTTWSQHQLDTTEQHFIDQYTKIKGFRSMTFNGHMDLEFNCPVYDWLIVSKYKVPNDASLAYFSGFAARWHYERDIEIIKEIRDLFDDQDRSNQCS